MAFTAARVTVPLHVAEIAPPTERGQNMHGLAPAQLEADKRH